MLAAHTPDQSRYHQHHRMHTSACLCLQCTSPHPIPQTWLPQKNAAVPSKEAPCVLHRARQLYKRASKAPIHLKHVPVLIQGREGL